MRPPPLPHIVLSRLAATTRRSRDSSLKLSYDCHLWSVCSPVYRPFLPSRWSTKFHATPHPAGDPLLHHLIGSHLFRLGLYPLAEPHLLSSGSRDSGRLLGEMAFLWSRRGELDPSPYLLRVVLPFFLLSPPSILPARAALSTFLSLAADKDASFVQERLPLGDSDEILFTSLPVVNFLQLAVAAIQRAPAADAPAKVGDQALGQGWQEITTKYRAYGKPWMRDEHVKEVGLGRFVLLARSLSLSLPSPYLAQVARESGDVDGVQTGRTMPINEGGDGRVALACCLVRVPLLSLVLTWSFSLRLLPSSARAPSGSSRRDKATT